MEIAIVGCGGLGSAIAYSILLSSIDNTSIKKLILIDNDCVEEKNLPFILGAPYITIGVPKTLAIIPILNSLNADLKIEGHHKTYPINKSKIKNSILIDCRDTPDEDSNFKYKFNIDGEYGSIIINPTDKKIKKISRYTINSSRFYTFLFANMCCNLVLNEKHNSVTGRTRWAVNLKKETPEVLYVNESNIYRRKS